MKLEICLLKNLSQFLQQIDDFVSKLRCVEFNTRNLLIILFYVYCEIDFGCKTTIINLNLKIQKKILLGTIT